MPKLDLEAIKARASHARKTLYSPPDAVTPLIYADIPALIARVEELEAENNMLLGTRRDPADVRRIQKLEAAIRKWCRECVTTEACPFIGCPLYPYRGGE